MLNLFLAALPVILLILLWVYRNVDGQLKDTLRRVFLLATFSVYLFVTLYYITEISSISDLFEGISIGPVNFNLFDSEGVSTYILNILLFVPLGFLLPLIWKKYRSFSITVLHGMLLSLNIEILQLFNHRVSDIDDLITNTVGTVFGFLLWKILAGKNKEDDNELTKNEFWKISAAIFLGIIFFKNLLI